jgi:hypothetical protein
MELDSVISSMDNTSKRFCVDNGGVLVTHCPGQNPAQLRPTWLHKPPQSHRFTPYVRYECLMQQTCSLRMPGAPRYSGSKCRNISDILVTGDQIDRIGSK